jgi:hypothetical protein
MFDRKCHQQQPLRLALSVESKTERMEWKTSTQDVLGFPADFHSMHSG